MDRALNGFNTIAPVYDPLTRIVFGREILRAQTEFLTVVPAGSNVLVVGGGTGRVAEQLLQLNPTCRIWYVDASSRMITYARRRLRHFSDRVEFVHGSWSDVPSLTYDVIVTQFFLDLFSETTCVRVVKTLDELLSRQGCWLATDFVNAKEWWGSVLLKVMYRFFRITAGIKADRLPDWISLLSQQGLVPAYERSFYHGLIRSVWFRRAGG